MQRLTAIFLTLCALAATAPAQNRAGLQAALSAMDTAAANFKSAQADFQWDQFQKVIEETDTQKGTIYFRRQADDVHMAADISAPDNKYVLFQDGKVQVYQPRIEQVTEYNAGKNKAEFESFLVLGFGGSGRDLQKNFDVKYGGSENVQGVDAAKLLLTPRSKRVAGMFNQVILWIDPARGISVQQQFFEPSGDYRLAKYTNIKLNQKLPDNVFKLKTPGKTKVVRPN